ncbi:RsmD family RNA methyltransferase [Leucobacter sp. USHLN153]|uniref:RsmD family RNA methyltransferase n=1 Tax=Leucobacter sp. USHLN153 TaxID=3081268 RepID=UPI0030190349
MTRIIAGAAGSLRLDVPKAGTRPTSDRVREAIFSTLGSWDLIEGTRVLDLYAGSGALGLEAASRGASSVTLVEKHPPAADVARRNARTVQKAFAKATAEAPEIDVVRQSVQAFLAAYAELDSAQPSGRSWDVVMLDPPYDLAESELAENLVALAPLVAEGGAVLVERSSRSPEPRWPGGLEPIREKRYGETVLWWAEPVAE